MISYSTENRYSYLWSKYRPAILKLMVDTTNSSQQYKFSDHEFKIVNPHEKGGHSFVLRVFQSKAVNDIRASIVAKDLLRILQQSKTATELMERSVFEFQMDKAFNLNIKREHAIKISNGESKQPLPYSPILVKPDVIKDIMNLTIDNEPDT